MKVATTNRSFMLYIGLAGLLLTDLAKKGDSSCYNGGKKERIHPKCCRPLVVNAIDIVSSHHEATLYVLDQLMPVLYWHLGEQVWLVHVFLM